MRFLLLVGLWLTVAVPAAHADPLRFAVAIGANRGQADEVHLRFAERDATRVGQVLVQLAGVPDENLLLLLDATPTRLQAAFADLAARIARLRSAQPGSKPLVFVYYSGHSSAVALHLGESSLPFQRLRELTTALGAETVVFILDGCRSGGMTRAKGARHAEPFKIAIESHLVAKGTAVLASSADNEEAQESDRLGGGIFTTHVIGALRGAADADGNKRVTLTEVFAYAYRETLASTSLTPSLQHPTYAYHLEGSDDLTLSRTDRGVGLAVVEFAQPGHFVVLQRGDAAMTADLQLTRPTDVLLPPGHYLVRLLGARVAREARIDLSEGGRARIDANAMSVLPYGRAVRRGLSQASFVSVSADVGGSGPMLTGLSPGYAAAVGAAVDWTGARLQARLRYSRSDANNTELRMLQQGLGGDLTAAHVFDLGPVGLGVGVRLGIDRIWQRFVTAGVAPDRAVWAWRAAPLVAAEWAPAPRWLAGLHCGLDVYQVQVLRDRVAVWHNPVVPFCNLSASMYLP